MFGSFKKSKVQNDALLFVGLGNPGDKHAANRHNVGFMIVDEIANEFSFGNFKSKFKALVSEGRVSNQKVILLKPQTYMNESGRSVQEAAKFFKIKPEHIIIFHDELDLEPSKLKVKLGGGNAGHNGLKSIQAHLGTPDFWRVRVGIGHPGDKRKVHSYVLKDFPKTELERWVGPLNGAIASNADLLVKGDEATFVNKVAQVVAANSG